MSYGAEGTEIGCHEKESKSKRKGEEMEQMKKSGALLNTSVNGEDGMSSRHFTFY